MSAATVFPEVLNPTLQNLAFALLTSTRYAGGTAAAGFTDRLGQAVPAKSNVSGGVASGPPTSQAFPGREVELFIRINPDGMTATCKVLVQSPAGLQTVEGQLDTSLLTGTTL